MIRPLRVEYPGAHYHIINRGNAGENIFSNSRDREKFLEYLAKAVERFSILAHSYCLMDNHYHLLIETPQPNLSLTIQWLNISYAVYYNKKHQRSGHLFQGRFKSILVDAEAYLTQLSRYIHLNPVRAKIVTNPADFPWSSYATYIGRANTPTWLTTEWLLSMFGNTSGKAIKNYRDFVEKTPIEAIKDPRQDLIGGFILGGTNFVQWVKETFLTSKDNDKEIPQLKGLKPKLSLETIVREVSDVFGCSKDMLREKGRKNNQPRKIAIYLARDLSGATCDKLGNFFGGISGAAITVRYGKIAGQMAEDK